MMGARLFFVLFVLSVLLLALFMKHNKKKFAQPCWVWCDCRQSVFCCEVAHCTFN